MDKLTNIKVFSVTAKFKSLARAAEKLNLSASSVSKHISALENHLGVRLMNRTTRKVSITDIGEAYLDKVNKIISDIEEAENMINATQKTPRGLLRIAAPSLFGSRHIAPHLPEFLEKYKKLNIELITYDDQIDIIKDSIDIAIILTKLDDSSLIAKKIAPGSRTIVASPEYIKINGEPETPDDLSAHKLVTYLGRSAYNDWHFNINGKKKVLHAQGSLSLSNGELILRSVLNGGGITMLSRHITGRQIREGKLKLLLDNYVEEVNPIYAVYPSNKLLQPKIKIFINYLIGLYSPNPYWMEGNNVNIEARKRALI